MIISVTGLDPPAPHKNWFESDPLSVTKNPLYKGFSFLKLLELKNGNSLLKLGEILKKNEID